MMQLGIFSDIHFQPQGLDRIIKTGDWIIEEFQRQGVQAVVCMGDALVTREAVDVVSQSAAINFFRKLADKWPVFLTLGNHDLNLKHSTSVSSLDGLDMHPKIKVFREITPVGDHFLFIPYYEDQSKIVAFVQDFARQFPERAAKMTVFGHLGINGAVQNTRYKTTFSGAVGPDVFAPFKATYSGHFHVFQRMDHRVTYCGSPLQFNFGDAGDQRGIMVLDMDTGNDRFILNPHHDAFKVLGVSDLPQDLTTLKDCFVTVIYDDLVTDEQHEALQLKLEAAGVISVRKESVIEKAIRDQEVEVLGVEATSAAGLVEPFVKSVITGDSQLDVDITIQFGKSIIAEVNSRFQDAEKGGMAFDGEVSSLTLEGFLGVKEKITINFDDLRPGVWYLEGENGAGKSTFLEAIFWCYFGETIRDEMKADDVVYDPQFTGKGKNCYVRVNHANGWSIERFRKYHDLGGTGVKVYKDGVYQESFEKGDPKATQKMIIDLIGIDRETYSRSYIMGQNVTANFMTGDEKKRRAMIEEMLGLERFDAYLEKTRELKKLMSDQLEQQANIQKVRAGEIERSAAQISAIETQILDAEKNHQVMLSSVAQRKNDHQVKMRQERERLMYAEASGEQTIQYSNDVVKAATEKVQLLSGGVEAIRVEAKANVDKAEETNKNIVRFQSLWNSRCIDHNNITNEENILKSEIGTVRDRITGLEAALKQEAAVVAANERANVLRQEATQKDQLAAAEGAKAEATTTQATPISQKAEKLSKLTTGGDCPTCLTSINGESMVNVVKGLNAELESLRAGYRTYKAEQTKLISEAQALRVQADESLKGLATLAQLAAAKTVLETLTKSLPDMEARLQAIAVRRQQVDARFAEQANQCLPMPERLEDIITASGFQRILDGLLAIMSAYRTKADLILASQAVTDLVSAKEALQKAQDEHKRLTGELSALLQEKSALEAGGAATEAALAQEERNLTATDPAAALKIAKDRLVADRQAAFAAMETSKAQAHALDLKSAYITFWDKAFAAKGSMRGFLLDQSVKQLNLVVQSYIGQHFGGKMTLTFNSDLTYQERYGRRSGGQRKWTDLAALFSIFELARQRSRHRAGFLALDEVFDALDVKGRRAVQDLIASMVNRVKRIFVITHADVPGSSRAGTIVATMVDEQTSWAIKPV
jgi:DNA repair exonuclease SbcCD ATPase subunit/DNA repair exonuclease SbcCD nuclease subunit